MPVESSGGPGGSWKVTIQPERGTAACCTVCKCKFATGELRLSRARAAAQRYAHLHCLAVSLGRPENVEGLAGLPEVVAAEVDPYLQADEDASMEDSAETPPTAGRTPDAAFSAPNSLAEVEAEIETDFAAPLVLKNMEWWADADEELLLNQAGTLSGLPASLSVAVAEAREAAARYAVDASDSTEEFCGWMCMLAFDRLIFGELKDPVDSDQRRTVTEKVALRLHDFWEGRWESLMKDTHVSARSKPGVTCVSRTVKRIERLLIKGEISKATALVWGPATFRTPTETAVAFASQQSKSPFDAADPLPHPDQAAARTLMEDIASHLQASWAKTPKGSGAGVQGDRFEHWTAMAKDGDGSPYTARLLSRLAGGSVPQPVLNVALAGRLMGIAKKDAGTRVIACGGIARRLVGRAACQVRKAEIADAAGPHQFGVGLPAGTEALHKVLTAKSEEMPDHAFVSLDARNAFVTVNRQKVIKSLATTCPDLAVLARQWYGRVSQHVVAGQGEVSKAVQQVHGLDQGCPLSPAFFASALAPALSNILDYARSLDSNSWIYAYLDDIYLVLPRVNLQRVLGHAGGKLREVGLEINEAKTKIWFPRGMPSDVPAHTARYVIDALPCLGSSLSFVKPRSGQPGDAEDESHRDVHVGIEDGTAPVEAKARLAEFAAALGKLVQAGLPVQHSWTLLRTYVNGAVTHIQRAKLAAEGAWTVFDDEVVRVVSEILGSPLSIASRTVAFLPAKFGGLGLASAAMRADAAWLASWEATRPLVRSDQGHGTEVQAETATPLLSRAVLEAQRRLSEAGAPARRARGQPLQQKGYVMPIQLQSWRSLIDCLPPAEAALLRSNGGLGAGAWLNPPRRSEHCMDDDAFIVSLRRRLLFRDPAAAAGQPCQHRHKDHRRGICSRTAVDDLGAHAVSCPVGPGRVKRHDTVKEALAEWLIEMHGSDAVAIEQHIPAWDRQTPEGPELAILDVVVTSPAGRVAIDVSITDVSSDGTRAPARAKNAGLAARARELEKHRRYPGRGLVAAVLETGGLAGKELHAFLRAHADSDPAVRSGQLQDIRQRLAVALQRGNAALLLSSARPHQQPWHSAIKTAGRLRTRQSTT